LARTNWLGSGIYFWDSDPRRAEYWQAIHGKGAILECELETELLIDMIANNQRSNGFLDLAKEIIPAAADGNLFPNQHIQICLWGSSAIRNPKRYIPGLISE
jgi:hypothetical protein